MFTIISVILHGKKIEQIDKQSKTAQNTMSFL